MSRNNRSSSSSRNSHSASSSRDNRSAGSTKNNRSVSSSRNNSPLSLSKNHSNSVSRSPTSVATSVAKSTVNTINRVNSSNNSRRSTNLSKNHFISASSSRHTNNLLTNTRFVATPHFVSDKQNRTDYSLSAFSKKMIDAVDIVSKNRKKLSKIEKSPFSGQYMPVGAIKLELQQAKSAIDKIPNNALSKTIAQNSLVSAIEESGKAFLKHNNELGHILVASAKKFNAASQMSDLFEFANYAFKNNKEKASEKLADISGGLAGAYAGAKVGARGGNLISLISGTILGGIASTKEGRKLLTSIVSTSQSPFKQGTFDNLEKYAIQAEKMKQEMSIFNNHSEQSPDINLPSTIFNSPSITQDSTK